MKKTIKTPEGQKIKISGNEKDVQRACIALENELKKANQIRKIEPIDIIQM